MTSATYSITMGLAFMKRDRIAIEYFDFVAHDLC